MAPPQGEEALRDAIARGADRAILLTDKRFAGADTLATSYTLASAIKKLGGADIIVAGEKSVDGDTGQVPGEVAEMLGLPHVSYVTKLVHADHARVVVEADMGEERLVMEVGLPCVLQVTPEVAKPRIPTVSAKLRARRVQVEKWTADDLADVADASRFGARGSPTIVYRVEIAKEKERKRVVLGIEEGVKKVLEVLAKEGVL